MRRVDCKRILQASYLVVHNKNKEEEDSVPINKCKCKVTTLLQIETVLYSRDNHLDAIPPFK